VIADKYAVERVLGAGGMGVVVAARHVQIEQRVAIKFIRGHAARKKSAVERFLREARAIAKFSNEHVAKVHDFGTLKNGAPYLVMEYLDGQDLAGALSEAGAMSVPQAVGFVVQACEAIAEAHALGIVHRDLKPSNLFLTRRMDGTPLVKVLDFGIAKTLRSGDVRAKQPSDRITASGLVVGSPGYMSPEQLRSAKDVDPRCDIWALGVILYELLTGKCPFAGETRADTLARVLSDEPVPLRELRPEVPHMLAATIAQCLERSIERRVQTVGELANRLLPFAPPEGAISVARAVRVSQAIATEQLVVEPTRPSVAAKKDPKTGTEPAWHKSGGAIVVPGVRRQRLVAMVGAGGLGLAVISMSGFFALRSLYRAPSESAATPGATTQAARPTLPAPMGGASNGTSMAAVGQPGAVQNSPAPAGVAPPPPSASVAVVSGPEVSSASNAISVSSARAARATLPTAATVVRPTPKAPASQRVDYDRY
jgi:serine/threonine-protein kinase